MDLGYRDAKFSHGVTIIDYLCGGWIGLRGLELWCGDCFEMIVDYFRHRLFMSKFC